jgi:hypothetical protein
LAVRDQAEAMGVAAHQQGMFVLERCPSAPISRTRTRDGARIILQPRLFDALLSLGFSGAPSRPGGERFGAHVEFEAAAAETCRPRREPRRLPLDGAP